MISSGPLVVSINTTVGASDSTASAEMSCPLWVTTGRFARVVSVEEVTRPTSRSPNPITEPFTHPGLDRLAATRADLTALGQETPEDPLPATADYAAAIRTTASTPERFIAHHYLRYLGDLSGGQAIAALMPATMTCPSKP